MEESDHLVVLEKGWLGGSRFREVADEGGGGVAASAVGIVEAGLKREVCCVAVLSWAWV